MKKLLTIILILSLFLLSGCNQKQTEKTGQTSQKAAIKPTVPEGWLKYENTTHKLSFYYPPNWQLRPEIEREDLLTFSLEFNDTSQEQKTFWDNTTGYPYYSLTIKVKNNPDNLSALDWAVKQYLPQSQAEMKTKYTPATLGSHQFIKDSGPVTPAGVYFSYQICPGNAKAYLFVHHADTSKKAEEKYLPAAEKILSSLEFLN